jgi:hypothetical protein
MNAKGDTAEHALGAGISPDLPIRTGNEDRLNRRGFAAAIAKMISSWRNRPSLVIGLFGEWGSGKSSIKNMVVESLTACSHNPVFVVEFSPWQISGQEMLVQTFFDEIGKAISKTAGDDADLAKRRAARWKLYSSALSMFATVAKAWKAVTHPTDPSHFVASGASLALGGVSEVAKAGAEGIEAEGSLDSLSLAELKEQIAFGFEIAAQADVGGLGRYRSADQGRDSSDVAIGQGERRFSERRLPLGRAKRGNAAITRRDCSRSGRSIS